VAGLIAALAVDLNLSGENQGAGLFARFGQTAIEEKLIQTFFDAGRGQFRVPELPRLRRSGFANALFAIALAGQRGLDALLLARLQVERVALGVLDDVLLQDLALETPQRAFDGLAILQMNLSQPGTPQKCPATRAGLKLQRYGAVRQT